jgi:Flp pilus assembly protein TadG
VRIFKNQRGQALVEFAIVLPILLLLVMGIAQFGMMFNSYLSLQNASRDGARAGAVGNSTTEIKNLILSTSPRLQESNLTITVTPSDANRKPGDTLTVKLSYDYKLTVPIISNIFNNAIKLNAQTSMRIE